MGAFPRRFFRMTSGDQTIEERLAIRPKKLQHSSSYKLNCHDLSDIEVFLRRGTTFSDCLLWFDNHH
jgi:hypothetical protein